MASYSTTRSLYQAMSPLFDYGGCLSALQKNGSKRLKITREPGKI